jgi:hypothetical protein
MLVMMVVMVDWVSVRLLLASVTPVVMFSMKVISVSSMLWLSSVISLVMHSIMVESVFTALWLFAIRCAAMFVIRPALALCDTTILPVTMLGRYMSRLLSMLIVLYCHY